MRRASLVPFNPTGQELAPVTRMAKAALEDGLYLMTRWNMVMVCPPLNITIEESTRGWRSSTRPLVSRTGSWRSERAGLDRTNGRVFESEAAGAGT